MDFVLDLVFTIAISCLTVFICRYIYYATPIERKVPVEELMSDSEIEAAKQTTRMQKQMSNLLNYDGTSKNQVDLEDEE